MGSRSGSRSPIRSQQDGPSEMDDTNSEPVNIPGVSEETASEESVQPKPKYMISLYNIPITWKVDDVKKFISGAVNSKHVTENFLFSFFKRNQVPNCPRVLWVKFKNKEAAEEACEQLQDAEINGNKLCPKMLPIIMRKPKVPKPSLIGKKIDTNFLNKDRKMKVFQTNFNKYTYGLNYQFLQKLGISLPLHPNIFVTNLSPQVDEKKLDEVFSLAGKVVNIHLKRTLDGSTRCMAVVTYDHPVEAVQAISMFNNRSLFDTQMQVHLDTKKNFSKNIPSGLSDIGPGLGDNGNPLQYVRPHVEIESIKHDIREWMQTTSETNQNLNVPNNSANTNIPKWQNDLLPMNPQITNPITFSNAVNPSPIVKPDLQSLLQGLVQQVNVVNALSAQNSLRSVPAFTANTGNQSTNQGWQVQGNKSINASLPQTSGNFSQSVTNQQLVHTKQNIGGFQGGMNGNFTKTPGQKKKLCFNCRKPGHEIRDCPTLRCDLCHGSGHSAAYCQAKSISESWGQRPQSSGTSEMSYERQEYSGSHKPRPVQMYETPKGRSPERCSSDMLVFKNLPPSVSIEALNSKMQEVGDVKFSEMTARGRAIVRFYRVRDAEKCITLYDRSRVDGQVIDVSYI